MSRTVREHISAVMAYAWAVAFVIWNAEIIISFVRGPLNHAIYIITFVVSMLTIVGQWLAYRGRKFGPSEGQESNLTHYPAALHDNALPKDRSRDTLHIPRPVNTCGYCGGQLRPTTVRCPSCNVRVVRDDHVSKRRTLELAAFLGTWLLLSVIVESVTGNVWFAIVVGFAGGQIVFNVARRATKEIWPLHE